MNVFVLSTGRCGSMTFATACEHMTNYTSGHETKSNKIRGRLINYPNNHIETDNRLAWMLGSLHKCYPHAFYVYLTRDTEEVARSYAKRFHIRAGIMSAFASGIIQQRRLPQTDEDKFYAATVYTHVVNDNIEEFLKDKKHITINIDDPHDKFIKFWDTIEARGDEQAALDEFKIHHNSRKQ